jgi:hypothetical protein
MRKDEKWFGIKVYKKSEYTITDYLPISRDKSMLLVEFYSRSANQQKLKLLGDELLKLYQNVFTSTHPMDNHPVLEFEEARRIHLDLILNKKELQEEISWLQNITDPLKFNELFQRLKELKGKMLDVHFNFRALVFHYQENPNKEDLDFKQKAALLIEGALKRLSPEEEILLLNAQHLERFPEMPWEKTLNFYHSRSSSIDALDSFNNALKEYRETVSKMNKPFWKNIINQNVGK